MNEGWIKLYQKFVDWEWYKDTNTKVLFLHCLLKANWRDGKFKGYEVPRGSFVTGRKKLSEELNLSEQQIRTSINRLKSTNEITIRTTKQFSIITINNYDLYQQNNQSFNQQLTNNQPTTNHNRRYIDNKTYIKEENITKEENQEIYDYNWLEEE